MTTSPNTHVLKVTSVQLSDRLHHQLLALQARTEILLALATIPSAGFVQSATSVSKVQLSPNPVILVTPVQKARPNPRHALLELIALL